MRRVSIGFKIGISYKGLIIRVSCFGGGGGSLKGFYHGSNIRVLGLGIRVLGFGVRLRRVKDVWLQVYVEIGARWVVWAWGLG